MAYKSRYEDQLVGALDKLRNREFNYDFNADPMYHAYKDQYTKLGNEAAMNAAANVSALTGGFGNSYAATAASQANQQYLTKLNEQIPALYENAMRKYQMEGDDLKDLYGALGDADARDYSKYRDEVADNQWKTQFDYGKERDKVSDEQWQKNYDQALKQFEESVRQYNNNFEYGKQRDAVADQQWLDQFNRAKERDAVADAQWREQFDYGKSRDAISDEQWRAQFDENNRRYNQEWTASQEAQAAALALAQQRMASSGSGSGSGGNKNSDEDNGFSNKYAKHKDEITRTVAMAHQTSPTDPDYTARTLGNYLDEMVSDKKITEKDAELIFNQYIYEEEKRRK